MVYTRNNFAVLCRKRVLLRDDEDGPVYTHDMHVLLLDEPELCALVDYYNLKWRGKVFNNLAPLMVRLMESSDPVHLYSRSRDVHFFILGFEESHFDSVKCNLFLSGAYTYDQWWKEQYCRYSSFLCTYGGIYHE